MEGRLGPRMKKAVLRILQRPEGAGPRTHHCPRAGPRIHLLLAAVRHSQRMEGHCCQRPVQGTYLQIHRAAGLPRSPPVRVHDPPVHLGVLAGAAQLRHLRMCHAHLQTGAGVRRDRLCTHQVGRRTVMGAVRLFHMTGAAPAVGRTSPMVGVRRILGAAVPGRIPVVLVLAHIQVVLVRVRIQMVMVLVRVRTRVELIAANNLGEVLVGERCTLLAVQEAANNSLAVAVVAANQVKCARVV